MDLGRVIVAQQWEIPRSLSMFCTIFMTPRTEAHEQDTMKEYGTWEQTHVQIVTLHELMCSNFLLHNKLGCLSSVLPNTANVESSGIARRSDFFAA